MKETFGGKWRYTHKRWHYLSDVLNDVFFACLGFNIAFGSPLTIFLVSITILLNMIVQVVMLSDVEITITVEE
jgi:hypothetical protein